MGMKSAKLGVTTGLRTLSLAASAATVSVEAFLITQHSVPPSADSVLNAPGCATGSTGSTGCVRIVENIGLGAWPVNTGTVTRTRSTFDTGNVSQVPNFVMNGNARAFASRGQLHASTFVQIQGAGGNNVSIGGRAHAQITDRVKVESSVLPAGTGVSVRVLLDVSGSGGGRLSFGLNGFNQQVGQSNDSAFNVDSLEDFESTFSAKVGRRALRDLWPDRVHPHDLQAGAPSTCSMAATTRLIAATPRISTGRASIRRWASR